MPQTVPEILDAALSLPVSDREDLVELLAASLEFSREAAVASTSLRDEDLHRSRFIGEPGQSDFSDHCDEYSRSGHDVSGQLAAVSRCGSSAPAVNWEQVRLSIRGQLDEEIAR